MASCGRVALAFNIARPHRSRCPCRCIFSDEELALLTSLAAPTERHLRTEFLTAVAAELETNGQAGAVGIGSGHRVARAVQRRFFDPPHLPNVSKEARA